MGITELMITPENIPFGKVTASYWGARTNENLHAGRRKRDQRGSRRDDVGEGGERLEGGVFVEGMRDGD